MKINKLLPFTVVTVGLLVTGCGKTSSNNTNNKDNTTRTETTTRSNISNNINGVFDGNRYNTDSYSIEGTTYDKNYKNGYKKEVSTKSRFGKGMKGAENIKGNQNKKSSIYRKEKEIYKDIKDTIKS